MNKIAEYLGMSDEPIYDGPPSILSLKITIECDFENNTTKMTYGPFKDGKIITREWVDSTFSLGPDLEMIYDEKTGEFLGSKRVSDFLILKLTGHAKP